MAVAGANVPDTKLLRPTLESIVVARPEGTQNLCLDKGYDIGVTQLRELRLGMG